MAAVVVCRKCKGGSALATALRHDGVPVDEVRCQSVCKGPVVGLSVDGRQEWFVRVKGGKARRAVVKAAGKGRVGRRLEEHRIRRRSGRPVR